MSSTENNPAITVRKQLDFGLAGDDIPQYWLAGDAYKTRVVDAVQATFPDGERYFISSVAAFRPQIKDPELLRQVKEFTMQEGEHGRVHKDYNERLKRQGLNMDAFTTHVKAVGDRRQRFYSAKYNLALTAALEHFTAMMAELFFAEKTLMKGADSRPRAMLAWHAIEEMEHRAVAFDVMQKVAGVGYIQRCLAMTQATFVLMLFTTVAPWIMLGTDGHSIRKRFALYTRGLPWIFGRRGFFTRLVPMLCQYYRPSFHPNQMPTVHNYEHWLSSYSESGDPVQAGEAMYAAAA